MNIQTLKAAATTAVLSAALALPCNVQAQDDGGSSVRKLRFGLSLVDHE